MAYVSFLRVKWVLFRFALVLIAILVLAQINALWDHHAHGIVTLDGKEQGVPLWFFIAGAAFGPAIIATILGTTLQRERVHRAIAWTLPRSRTRTALTIVSIDLMGLVLAYVLMLVFVVLPLIAYLGSGQIRSTGNEFPIFGYGLVFVFLWYALVQVATSWYSSRGGAVAGLSWPVFLIAAGLETAKGLPDAIRWLLGAFNVINPMIYIGQLFDSIDHHATGLSTPDLLTSIGEMLVIGAVALVLAVVGWRRPVG